jgi:hypothetical protein
MSEVYLTTPFDIAEIGEKSTTSGPVVKLLLWLLLALVACRWRHLWKAARHERRPKRHGRPRALS